MKKKIELTKFGHKRERIKYGLMRITIHTYVTSGDYAEQFAHMLLVLIPPFLRSLIRHLPFFIFSDDDCCTGKRSSDLDEESRTGIPNKLSGGDTEYCNLKKLRAKLKIKLKQRHLINKVNWTIDFNNFNRNLWFHLISFEAL